MKKINDKDVVLIFASIPIILIVIVAFVTGLSSHYPEPPKIISVIVWLLIAVWLLALCYIIIRLIGWAYRFCRKLLSR